MDISPVTFNGGGPTAAGVDETSPPARHSIATHPGRCSRRLLGELLALNVEMVGQLELERLSDSGTAGFLTKMIEHHEKAAGLLRTELARQEYAGSMGRR
jgi:hypothetical protein